MEITSKFLKETNAKDSKATCSQPLPFYFQIKDYLIKNFPKRILILGGLDAGKTSLANFLYKSLENVALLDCDIGQKHILPPGTITLLQNKETFHWFIGSVAPSGFFGEILTGIQKLIQKLKKEMLVLDPPGFIYNSGEELQRQIIFTFEPDLIIALEKREGELAHILRYYKGKILKFSVTDFVKRHSKEERKRLRIEKWKNYFEKTNFFEVSFSQVSLSGSKIFQGRPVSEEEKALLKSLFKWEILWARFQEERWVVVKREIERIFRNFNRDALFFIEEEVFKNLLSGLLDEEGICQGLCLIKEIDFQREVLKIETPLESLEKVKEIRFGRIKFDGTREFFIPKESF